MNTDSYPRLFKLIRECAQTTDRLPPEDVLAQQLGISRVKLRDMLATLQANGYISRKKGIGTLINKHMLAETARLDMDTVYEEMISESGHIPSMLVQKIKLVSDIPQEIRDRLQLAPEDTAYLIEKTAFADDIPAIFTIDYIPAKYYDESALDIRLIAQCTFFFVQRYCDELLDNLIVHAEAIAAGHTIADRLQLPEGAPVLKLSSICYSQKLKPIMSSVEYYNTNMLPLSFLKRISRTKQQ